MSEQQVFFKQGAVRVQPDLEDELAQQLAEASMESLLGEAPTNFKEGEVVRGRVVEIGEDRVLVDIGYKSEGIVATGEFPQPDQLAIGDEYDFYIDEPENEAGMPILSKTKAEAALAASIFHYGQHTVQEAKDYLRHRGVPVR